MSNLTFDWQISEYINENKNPVLRVFRGTGFVSFEKSCIILCLML